MLNLPNEVRKSMVKLYIFVSELELPALSLSSLATSLKIICFGIDRLHHTRLSLLVSLKDGKHHLLGGVKSGH